MACLCLRVPPGAKAGRATDSHPAWRDRIATMRAVLDSLSEQTGRARHATLRAAVVDPLAAAVLGQVPAASNPGEELAGRVVAAVRKHRPCLVYGDADSAIAVAAALSRRQPARPVGSSVLAVLDGAWRWRLSQPSRQHDDEVAALVVDYCRHDPSGAA
ncbi:hypothetical protein AB0M20_27710 [Actinoplanes sp. NPDC051633]|uniref:hypothetical protein n=1 Tax=Actinoplanes sp. NPDC051633 TaxID=3155670 RepID=UPI0034445C97